MAEPERRSSSNLILGSSVILFLLVAVSAPRAFVWRADVCRAKQDWDGAYKNYNLAIALGLRSAHTYLGRADARKIINGDYDGAVRDFERALEFDPSLSGCTYFHIDRGNQRRDQGDWNGAIADFNRAIDLDPGHKTAWSVRYRAEAKLAKGDTEDAIADFERCIELGQGRHLYLPYMIGGPPPEVMEAGQEAGRRLSAKYISLGRACQNSGDVEAAIDHYTQSIVVGWGHPEAFYYRGSARAATGDLVEAAADYDRFLERAPGDVRAEEARKRIADFEARLEKR